MQPLPRGTVTFVFTDIKGSTEHWDTTVTPKSAVLGSPTRRQVVIRVTLVRPYWMPVTQPDAACRPPQAVRDIR